MDFKGYVACSALVIARKLTNCKDEISRTPSRIHDAQISQPLCTAVQLGLVDLLTSWGIAPSFVIGHSSGEIAAAYSAGAISAESALQVAYERGIAAAQVSTQTSGRRGAMLAVALSAVKVKSFLETLKAGRAVIACLNSPANTTVSGDKLAILELKSSLEHNNISCRELNLDTAYHSHHMESVADIYQRALSGLQAGSHGSADFYSTVTGSVFDTSKLDAQYWVRNLVSCVRFDEALRQLFAKCGLEPGRFGVDGSDPVNIILEIGPHTALRSPIQQIITSMPNLTAKEISYVGTLIRNKDSTSSLLNTACRLFEAGCELIGSRLNPSLPGRPPQVAVDLPPCE